YLSTPIGVARIEGDEHGLSQIKLLDEDEPVDFSTPKELPSVLRDGKKQLDAYFNGELREFNLLLNPQGTDFQQKVWKVLQEIPYGELLSHAEVAKKIDNPKAVRAVANANGKNPLWIVTPCHRVVGSDGTLTG